MFLKTLIHNDIVSTKIYDKRDDFNFDIVNFPFLDGDVPQCPSYGVYISQLIRFSNASSHVTDFYDDALTELVNHYANRTLIVSCTKDYT